MTSGVCICRIMPEFFTREVTINIIFIQYPLIPPVKIILIVVVIITAAAVATTTITINNATFRRNNQLHRQK